MATRSTHSTQPHIIYGTVVHKYKLLICCGLSLLGVFASAETPQEARIRKMVQPKLGQNIQVDSVKKTPYAGLFEVRTNGDIFYTDEKTDYLIIGRVVETKTYQDLTKARVEEINAINFSELPFDSAIKIVKGHGKRVMAIFADPNCVYCKNLHRITQKIDNVTIFIFLLNIVSPDSAAISRQIWCSRDPRKAWDNQMLGITLVQETASDCVAPHEKILALGKKLKIKGTPTIYFSDGSRAAGFDDANALEAKLISIK